MNIYVIVEGERTERLVYEKWITYVNPLLSPVQNLSSMASNNFVIFAGYGYPFYLEMIDAAINDVNEHGKIDRLVIAVDSDEMTKRDKKDEIQSKLNGKVCTASIHIVIQHFCLETWALGNRKIIGRNPTSAKLRDYIGKYNVVRKDPELLPSLPSEGINRSQFALKYLRATVNDKHRNLTYSKTNPTVLVHDYYFKQVRKRMETTSHISSFGEFIHAFT